MHAFKVGDRVRYDAIQLTFTGTVVAEKPARPCGNRNYLQVLWDGASRPCTEFAPVLVKLD